VKCSQSGMTLIEMMITLVLITISIGLAVPNYQAMIERNRAKTQINDFLMSINLARSEALKIGSDVSIQAVDGSDDGNEFGPGWCVVAGNPGNCNGTVVRSYAALTDESLLDSSENATSIQFDSLGSLSGGVIQKVDLCNSTISQRRVFISLNGRAKIHRPTDPVEVKRPECDG
jgi:type IV fimbrial biogenesis protein FimT